MSATLQVQSHGFSTTKRQLLQFANQNFQQELLESIGAMVESQTRQRIQEDKTGPDGKAWPKWSERYGKTRNSGQSLLQNEGDLLDSIQYLVNGKEVEIGSNLVYAATHQYGDEARSIPARTFLGLSDENERELDDLIQGFIQDLLT